MQILCTIAYMGVGSAVGGSVNIPLGESDGTIEISVGLKECRIGYFAGEEKGESGGM